MKTTLKNARAMANYAQKLADFCERHERMIRNYSFRARPITHLEAINGIECECAFAAGAKLIALEIQPDTSKWTMSKEHRRTVFYSALDGVNVFLVVPEYVNVTKRPAF